ncbi:NHLP family bacteriocin export ABC transporter peptidase/permease/ATPase subunit [Phocaeicola sp.]
MFGVKKVPVIMQMEMVECGAASLGMILAYHGKWLPLEQLRKDCGVSRDGCSARQLMRVGRDYGLEVQGFRAEAADLPPLAPAIIHWNFNHFLVFNGFRGKKAYLNDPARGRVAVSREEFDKSFTGIVLAFRKGDHFVPSGRQASIGGFIRRRLKGTGAAFFFTLVMGILSAFIGLVTPLFTQVFMDNILSGSNREWFKPFMVALSGLVIFNFLVFAVQGIYKRRFSGSMAIEANANFFWHILRLPVEFFSQRYVGDLIFRQRSNQTITSTLVDKLGPLFINILLLGLYLFFMLQYSVLLTLVGLGVVLINMVVVRYISRRRVDMSRAAELDQGKFFGVTMSCLDNMETIKAAGAEGGFFEHWAGYFACMHNSSMRIDRYSTLMNILPQLLAQFANSLVLVLGIYLILGGEFTIGMLLAFQGFMGAFLTPVNQLLSTGETIIEMRTQMERVEDIFKYPCDISEGGSRRTENGKLGGSLELRHVTFGYNAHSKPQITDFSLSLKSGQSVALVGASGCGKSTLAKLISGLYKPWEGEILFDGRSHAEISHQEFVNSVAVIDQNVVLFDDTIAANIKMWDSSIEDFAMILASRDAQIREDIIARPGGFGAKLVKGGQNFSGGQRQRIEIATALAREPVILIMDEATSALDADTEEKVMKSIRMSGVTLIIVAHRLSTIRDCDEIIVLDRGVVVERGTHDSLMAAGGKYKELMESN